MSRLIDADALIKVLNKNSIFQKVTNVEGKNTIEIINEQPTIEAVEVVHGEWEEITYDWSGETIYSCSLCKEDFVTIDGTPAENLYNFCPNRGADMKKSISWYALHKRIGKQTIHKTRNTKVQILIGGELRECALVFTNNGSDFHLEICK